VPGRKQTKKTQGPDRTRAGGAQIQSRMSKGMKGKWGGSPQNHEKPRPGRQLCEKKAGGPTSLKQTGAETSKQTAL